MVLPLKGLKDYGGETGIRTLDTLRYTRFPSVRLQPLGHLSANCGPVSIYHTVTARTYLPPCLPNLSQCRLLVGIDRSVLVDPHHREDLLEMSTQPEDTHL